MNKKCRILKMVQVQSEIYNDISLALSKISVSHLFFHAVKVFGIEPCLLPESSNILFSLHLVFLDFFKKSVEFQDLSKYSVKNTSLK